MDSQQEHFTRQLDSVGWALFFIWIGVALLANVGWVWGLLGVAVIILGGEGIRQLKSLPVQGFWLAVGLSIADALGDLSLDEAHEYAKASHAIPGFRSCALGKGPARERVAALAKIA